MKGKIGSQRSTEVNSVKTIKSSSGKRAGEAPGSLNLIPPSVGKKVESS